MQRLPSTTTGAIARPSLRDPVEQRRDLARGIRDHEATRVVASLLEHDPRAALVDQHGVERPAVVDGELDHLIARYARLGRIVAARRFIGRRARDTQQGKNDPAHPDFLDGRAVRQQRACHGRRTPDPRGL
jgi:hypothetical protein